GAIRTGLRNAGPLRQRLPRLRAGLPPQRLSARRSAAARALWARRVRRQWRQLGDVQRPRRRLRRYLHRPLPGQRRRRALPRAVRLRRAGAARRRRGRRHGVRPLRRDGRQRVPPRLQQPPQRRSGARCPLARTAWTAAGERDEPRPGLRPPL
ncbi:MAG: hypothetical protein AVDCRST_MAG89-3338, partial [uncultured Gemmatimonadetes bacterium]